MLTVYCSEQRDKVEFIPLVAGKVKMYVCGPTVYDRCHIGHARPAVVFDTIRRYLEYAGYAVTFLSNITDIDDKIINRAKQLGISCAALTSRYQDEYETDMAKLGVRTPTIRPKATEHIAEMIILIEALLEKNIAYPTSRGVWFDVTKFADYGRLSGKFTDDDQTEHRVEQDPEKRNAADFALWKFSKPDEPQWESPFGSGRPGWHIECSAMSGKYCGMQLDIHGGGADLLFPHHENELAQSEAVTGKKFVNYWLHNGFITIAKDDGEEAKMGKSKGNAFWLREAFKICGAAALRFWILGTHYRMPLLYKPELLIGAQNRLNRIYNCVEQLQGIDSAPAPFFSAWSNANLADKEKFVVHSEWSSILVHIGKEFIAAMNDDFNTPQAIAQISALLTMINTNLSKFKQEEAVAAREMLYEFLSILGLPLIRPENNQSVGEKYLEYLLELRLEARAKKDFATADAIRVKLSEFGVTVKDHATGSRRE